MAAKRTSCTTSLTAVRVRPVSDVRPNALNR